MGTRGQAGIEYLLLIGGVVIIAVLVLLVTRNAATAGNERAVGEVHNIETGSCPQEARLRGEEPAGCNCTFGAECLSRNCSSGVCAS